MVENRVSIYFEETSIPVKYSVEGTGNQRMIACTVDLPEEKRPEWLTVTTFSFRVLKRDTITSWHTVAPHNIGLQTGLMISETLPHIRVQMIHRGLMPQ